MAKALYFFLFFLVAQFNSFAQSSINDYKYIIVLDKFEFLNEKNQYDINLLTKFLFNKYGYKAFMQDDDLPEDLQNNRCLGLMANVVKDGGFLKTKLRIDLKDCNGNIVKSSQTGETRVKEYDKAYNLALRDAFTTFQDMNYSYKPNDKIVANTTSLTINTSTDASIREKEEIARLKEEIKTLKEEKVEMVEVERPKEDIKEKVKEVTQIQPEEKIAIVSESFHKSSEVLYAQPIENGFQIVDTTPKKVMILKNSGVKDVFKVEGTKAIVYKKGDIWMYSESGDIFEGQVINIKF